MILQIEPESSCYMLSTIQARDDQGQAGAEVSGCRCNASQPVYPMSSTLTIASRIDDTVFDSTVCNELSLLLFVEGKQNRVPVVYTAVEIPFMPFCAFRFDPLQTVAIFND